MTSLKLLDAFAPTKFMKRSQKEIQIHTFYCTFFNNFGTLCIEIKYEKKPKQKKNTSARISDDLATASSAYFFAVDSQLLHI